MGIKSRIQRSEETAPKEVEETKPAETAAPKEDTAPAEPEKGEEEPAAPKEKAEPKEKAAPPATRKPQQAGALATAKDTASLVALKDQIDPTEFGYGDVPRIVANNNMIYGPDKMKLGTWIDVQVLSHSQRWMVSPGSDDDEAASLVRASYDGETILHNGEDNGKLVADYIEELKEAGYDKAAVKEYLDIFCLLLDAENHDNAELLAQEGMLNISLSPQSKGKYNAYAKQIKLTVMRGLISPDKTSVVRFKTSLKSANNRDFTLLVPVVPPKEVSDAAVIIGLE